MTIRYKERALEIVTTSLGGYCGYCGERGGHKPGCGVALGLPNRWIKAQTLCAHCGTPLGAHATTCPAAQEGVEATQEPPHRHAWRVQTVNVFCGDVGESDEVRANAVCRGCGEARSLSLALS